MHTPERDFERLYQQAYYRHSCFGPQADEAPAAPVRTYSPRPMPGSTQNLVFAGLALVMFVVPALAAALVV